MKYITFLGLVMTMFVSCAPYNEESTAIETDSNDGWVITETHDFVDESRNRLIPLEIYKISNRQNIKDLVLLNAGYGCSNTEYSFIAKSLAQKGYLVAATHHEQEGDDFLPSGENMYQARLPNWKEGVKNLDAIVDKLKKIYPTIDFNALNLIGHSNGGDIATLFSTANSPKVKHLITLDHRRMHLLRTDDFKTLSIRADEFEADEGVLPNATELELYPIEIVVLENVGHNYLRDNGTANTKRIILNSIHNFLVK